MPRPVASVPKLAYDLGGKYPLGHKNWRTGQVEQPSGYPPIYPNCVNRHFGPATLGQAGDRLDRMAESQA